MINKNKTLLRFFSILTFVLLFGLFACNNQAKQEQTKEEIKVVDPSQFIDAEAKLMLAYLSELGDYVNSRTFPSLIKATSVYEGLGSKQLIIDIRKPEEFKKGHIKGAVNIDFTAIPDYFESEITPFEFDKIVLVSDDGQASSYATCLLRLMGYGNVYALRWGMSSWNNDFAKEYWLKALGSNYENQLESKENEKGAPQQMPVLNTGKSTGEEILLTRVHQLFSEGSEAAQVSADQVFASNESYYIMNYIRKDNYDAAHIPNAIRYKPEGLLGIVSEMVTLPTDKTSVVYCGTGHNSEFVAAYMRLFGYDTKALIYGNNSFMHNLMVADKGTLSYLPFTSAEVGDYEYVK